MRPPWRRYSKKDPGFSSCRGIHAVVVCFAFCRSSCQEADRRFLRYSAYVDSTPGFSPATAPWCLQLLSSSTAETGMHRPFSNTSGFNGERYPADNARSIKRIRRKLLAWVDAKGTSRGTRYANAEFLKILRNILLAGNFPAGILCPQKLPPSELSKGLEVCQVV